MLSASGNPREMRVKRHGKLEEHGELAIQLGSQEGLNGLIDRLRAAS